MQPFVYTTDMQDSDASNARSAAYRVIRDNVGLEKATDGKLSQESKKLHAIAGEAARSEVSLLLKVFTNRQKRGQWNETVTQKAMLALAKCGVDAYAKVYDDEGYEVSDALKERAIKAFAVRLRERAAKTEREWIAKQETEKNAADMLADIFGEASTDSTPDSEEEDVAEEDEDEEEDA